MKFKTIISFFISTFLLASCSHIGDPKAVTLALADVQFDKETGAIIDYIPKYKDIIIPDNFEGAPVTTIGLKAFYKNGLTSVVIPESVLLFGKYTFQSLSHEPVKIIRV